VLHLYVLLDDEGTDSLSSMSVSSCTPIFSSVSHLQLGLKTLCSSRRQKCNFEPGAVKCNHCHSKGIDCTGNRAIEGLSKPKRRDSRLLLAPKETPYQGNTTTLPHLSLCLELVELYFDLIHDQFHTLFHRPSFTNAVEQGKAPPLILYAMLALSARSVNFSDVIYDRGLIQT